MKRRMAMFLAAALLFAASCAAKPSAETETTATPEVSAAPTPTASPTPTPEMIPFEIQRTLYQETYAEDGTLLVQMESWQPVFAEDSAAARRMNAVFEEERNSGWKLEDFDWNVEEYNRREGAVYESIRVGLVPGRLQNCELTYARNNILSFRLYLYVEGVGARGFYSETYGHTFNVETGEELALRDVLMIDESNAGDILAEEILKVYEFPGNQYDDETVWIEEIKKLSTLDQVFWLEEDGVHVYYGGQFVDRYGDRAVVIPYARTDLIREAFQ
ncbi:MAG: hypothetical protein LBT12_03450 [Oscillospiraceae bacterium]|nr:hypothetical protein [Oscillospiraceae bacterium]